jgi:hypothetical protein
VTTRRQNFVATDTVVAMFRNAPSLDAHHFRNDLDAVVDQTQPRGSVIPRGQVARND